MPVATAAPRLVGSEPNVLNTGQELFVSMPLANVGGLAAFNVFVTGFTLASAIRLSPQVLPVFVGDIAVGNIGATNARFNAVGLVPGQKYLLTVRGTYGSSPSKLGFAASRYVTIPKVAPYPVPLLKASVQASVQPTVWNYTIWNYTILNDEPAGSPQCLAGFSLSIVTPVTIEATPPGWSVETDNLTYVYWFAADDSLPYPNHVRPGDSLSGFQLHSPMSRSESTPYVLSSWRQDTNEAGLVWPDVVITPSRGT